MAGEVVAVLALVVFLVALDLLTIWVEERRESGADAREGGREHPAG